VFREAAYVVLVPDLRTVDVHVKDPAAAFDELNAGAILLLDCVRQTGGCRFVVSLDAVLDRDLH